MYQSLNECLCCGSNELKLILDLGKQPLANSYHKPEEKLDEFPLALNLCKNCYHLQLTVAVDPDLMFKNYLYVSGTSKTMLEHFEQFAKKVKEQNPLAKSVLDIACNDGSQLDYFKQLGFDTYGVDPAENLLEISRNKGHNVACEYFNKDFCKNAQRSFDVILAQNVFAHNSYPLEFLKCAKEILNDNGSIYIQTSQANMIKNNEFDTIYHEHISFFNLNSMSELCKRAGLFLVDSWKESIHGTSYVFKIQKSNTGTACKTDEQFLYNEQVYDEYAKRCYATRDAFNAAIQNLSSTHNIVGYGAAAKGNTFLNFSGMKFDYIVDDNPMKQNLQTPGSNIWIENPKALEYQKSKPTIYVPLAWNFFNEISNKINTITGKSNLYLMYFPEVRLIYK